MKRATSPGKGMRARMTSTISVKRVTRKPSLVEVVDAYVKSGKMKSYRSMEAMLKALGI
ncbi:hypothetical protein HY285_05010 [Candidatus Peregrinibacteria bacterium]|nr:hypothetical protein [Candidatus Peregrinibacteria bacterium]MBI3816871.1 hypothetical protein [Candidatus Peregrinibacteria bacterium]